MTVQDLPLLPLSVSSFSDLRKWKMVYVDKTDLVCALAKQPRKFFLTRPRRFGKSLLVSTFESLFTHGLRDFKGLKAEHLWHDDASYNVVHLDFSEIKEFRTLRDFQIQLARSLRDAFAPYGFRPNESHPETLHLDLSEWFKTQPGTSLVLLIDEYDAPLVSVMNNAEFFVEIRSELNKIYATFKKNDGVLRFMFVTGIVKFSQTGIFSVLNQLIDISLDPRYGALLGYTDEEVRQYFHPHIRRAAQVLNCTESAVLEKLKLHYDGFCFDDLVSTHVHTPWSVLNFLDAPIRGFKNYWATSGSQISLLQQYLNDHCLSDPRNFQKELTVEYSTLDTTTDLQGLDETALLVETGYLTFKRREMDTFFVSYPNKEVAESMGKIYTQRLLNNRSLPSVGAGSLLKVLAEGDIDEAFAEINRAFLSIDYRHYPIHSEADCRAYLQVFLLGAGLTPQPEQHNALGRSDLEFDIADRHWVVELKYQPAATNTPDRLLLAARDQVIRHHYGEASSKKLVRAVAVFSEKERRFVVWSAV